MRLSLDDNLHTIPIGKAEVLREGNDIAIIAIGSMVNPALEASQKLALNGIAATVINARFAKPLDLKLIQEVARQTKKIFTIEENALKGGFGSSVTYY